MDRCGVVGTARASLGMYNTKGDVDMLVEGLKKIRERALESKGSRGRGVEGSRREEVLVWPGAAGTSPSAVADALAEDFELLGEREARNQYLLDLGDKLPHTFEMLKKVTPRVAGCMSEVYLVGRKSPADPSRMEFMADANADIVRGLIAVLERLYSGQKASDVLAFDIEGFFRRIGLDQFISSQRRNGLAGMVNKIREIAKQTTAAS
jgi:cysteine desulfurase/selenocysteine lyase